MQTPRNHILKKIKSEEAFFGSFFYMVPNGKDSGTRDIYIQNMVLFFSKIGAARNLAGRNYAVTKII